MGDVARQEAPEETEGSGLQVVVVVTVATLATAWCAFQSALWGSRQAFAIVDTTRAHVLSTEAHLEANQRAMIDVATFVQLRQAERRGDDEDARIFRDSFRPELRAAIAAWEEARRRDPEHAPPSPFAMPEYRVRERARGDRLLDDADRASQRAMADNRNSDEYAMMTVLLSAASSLAGLGEKLSRPLPRRILSIVAVLVLALSLVRVALMPIAGVG